MRHRLRRQNPDKEFLPADRAAECRYMKMITLANLRDSLRHLVHEVTVKLTRNVLASYAA